MPHSHLLQEVRAGLCRHPLRSFLMLFTFALGFAMVVVTVAAVEGGRQRIREDLHNLGVDVVACLNPVEVQVTKRWSIDIGHAGKRKIDNQAIEELSRELGSRVREVIPMRIELSKIRDENLDMRTTLMATTPEFARVLRTGLLAGRFLAAEDRFGSDVVPVVLDEALARDFDRENPASTVGREFQGTRRGRPYRARVVGVMKDPITLRRHLDAFDAFSSSRVVTARRLEFRNVYVAYDAELDAPSGVLVQAWDAADVESLGEQISRFFQERDIEPYYHVQKVWVESLVAIVDRFSFLAHLIWMLALLVVLILTGTISLMAIEERYREVAIRRVEGARVWQVVTPLMGEGMVLALLSAPLGYLLARWILAIYVVPVLIWDPVFPTQAVFGTPLLLLLMGAATNLLPARRVARLMPATVLGQVQ